MADLGRPERLQIMLSAEELAALDDWRFARRMPSRAAAIRDLLRLGLAAEGAELAGANRRSSNFGVLSNAPMRGTARRLESPALHGPVAVAHGLDERRRLSAAGDDDAG
jgi:hypothetical protein